MNFAANRHRGARTDNIPHQFTAQLIVFTSLFIKIIHATYIPALESNFHQLMDIGLF